MAALFFLAATFLTADLTFLRQHTHGADRLRERAEEWTFARAADLAEIDSSALRDVAENTILSQQEFNRAFVLMQYFGYLRRNPYDAPESTRDYGGYNFWLAKLNQFNGD